MSVSVAELLLTTVSVTPFGAAITALLASVPVADAATLARVTEAAFGQRRKMLRQSLKSLGAERLLAATGIDGTRRAETLSVEEFVALANAV